MLCYDRRLGQKLNLTVILYTRNSTLSAPSPSAACHSGGGGHVHRLALGTTSLSPWSLSRSTTHWTRRRPTSTFRRPPSASCREKRGVGVSPPSPTLIQFNPVAGRPLLIPCHPLSSSGRHPASVCQPCRRKGGALRGQEQACGAPSQHQPSPLGCCA